MYNWSTRPIKDVRISGIFKKYKISILPSSLNKIRGTSIKGKRVMKNADKQTEKTTLSIRVLQHNILGGCEEAVNWIVFKNPLGLHSSHLMAFQVYSSIKLKHGIK